MYCTPRRIIPQTNNHRAALPNRLARRLILRSLYVLQAELAPVSPDPSQQSTPVVIKLAAELQGACERQHVNELLRSLGAVVYA